MMDKKYWESIRGIARDLRKHQTKSEKILWRYLRNRKLKGVKFFRQHPIVYHQHRRDYFFVADFYSKEALLVIEMDGKVHELQKDYDERDLINGKGLRVIRITNNEIEKNLPKAQDTIEHALTHPHPLSTIREGCPQGGES